MFISKFFRPNQAGKRFIIIFLRISICCPSKVPGRSFHYGIVLCQSVFSLYQLDPSSITLTNHYAVCSPNEFIQHPTTWKTSCHVWIVGTPTVSRIEIFLFRFSWRLRLVLRHIVYRQYECILCILNLSYFKKILYFQCVEEPLS